MSNTWRCLYQSAFYISTITSMLLNGNELFLAGKVYVIFQSVRSDDFFRAGWASPSSSWRGNVIQLPYAIARLNIAGYIDEHNYYFGLYSDKKNKSSSTNNSSNSNSSSTDNSKNSNGNGSKSKKPTLEGPFRRRLNTQNIAHHKEYRSQKSKRNHLYNGNGMEGSGSSAGCKEFLSIFRLQCIFEYFFAVNNASEVPLRPHKERRRNEERRQVSEKTFFLGSSNSTFSPTHSPTPG